MNMSVQGKQTINGTEYVYEYVSIWNAAKKRSEQKRNYIGKNSNGIFVPNKKYKLQQQLHMAKTEVKPGPVPITECKRLFYGSTYLLDAIGKKIGITEDLKKCFPESYQEILSLVYFLVLEEHTPIYRFHKWAVTHDHPFHFDIPSQRSSELFGRLTEEQKMKFFALQSKRRSEHEYLAYDTTSISSYSQSLKQAQYGKNKEHDFLPQINLALLYGESSKLPVYYRKLAGNITDVKTIENLIKDVDFLNMEKLSLVMDRGFYSEANINELFRKHHKFLIGTRTSLKLVRKKLDEVRDTFVSRPNYNSETQLYIKSFRMEWNYMENQPRTGKVITDKRRIYIHYYYNDQHATDDKKRFNHLLDTLEAELFSGKRNPEHEKLYRKYYDIKETSIRGVKLVPKQDAIDTAEKDYGYFALMSNGIKSSVEALKIYRTKDLIEKAFGNLKERLNMRRMSVASEENLEGKLFIQFVALIYLSYIKKAMDDNKLFKTYTMQELLDELDIIEIYQQPGRQHHLGEITNKQKKLYQYMGVEEPS
jgi:transposase